jgi:hypothetical protein
MKIKFKHTELTYAKCVNSILRTYNRNESFDGTWYNKAHLLAVSLSVRYDKPLHKVCGIIAALSPLKTWKENVLIAESFLKTGKAKHIKLFKNKAEDILYHSDTIEQTADFLKGRKITAFFFNILQPTESANVTIDRHALSIILGYSITDTEYQGITAKQYEFFQQCYVLASIKVGISPLQMQSITWQVWRQEKGISDNF